MLLGISVFLMENSSAVVGGEKIGRQNNTQDCRAPSRADFFVELHVPFGRSRVGMGFLPKKAGIIKRAALQWGWCSAA